MARDLLALRIEAKVRRVRHAACSRTLICAFGLTFAACGRERAAPADPQASASRSASASASASSEARRPANAPLAGELVDIPGGSFKAGSRPAEPGRQPQLEPRLYDVELGPFRISRLPYPNDPKKPPLTGVDREQAKRLCAASGARLCTELEWERACKGPNSDPFGSGPQWHARCLNQPESCASGFDVLGMGTSQREWVASDVIPSDARGLRRAVVRGAGKQEAAGAHRCARRVGIDPASQAPDLGFRCCQGPPNAAVVPEPKLEVTFEKTRIPAERLERLLAAEPSTRAVARDVVLFREPDAANTVIARGPGDTQGFSFSVSPLLYRPVAGTEYLVVSARSGERTSFVVAYHVMGKDTYELAASFIMHDEPGPIAFAYDNYIRPRFHFSSCWGCPAGTELSSETGKILFREPEEIVILQP